MLANQGPKVIILNLYYLIAFSFPIVAFAFMYISSVISDSQFAATFGDYVEVPCIVHKVDCHNHGHYNIIKKDSKDGQIYESSHRENCIDQYEGKEVTGYFSSKNPEIVSYLEPKRIIKGNNRIKWDLWIPAFCLGIPFYLFSYIQTYHGRAKYLKFELFKRKS